MTNNYFFIKKVKDALRRYNMVSKDDVVLVALSGGADSVALLYSMVEISGTKRVKAAHFNHLLRDEESFRDEEFSREICSSLKIEFFSERCDVKRYSTENKLSLEEAARILRYKFLNEVMKSQKCSKIATAHHIDDNSELVLMNLIRGAGQDGLSGIPPVRDYIIRPFIEVSRDEILNFLGEREYVTDSSNLDTSILRNRVRLKLLPYIKENFNPSFQDSLNRLSTLLRCDRDYFDDAVNKIFEKKCSYISENCIVLSSEDLLNQHYSIGSRLIRKIIKEINGNLKKFTSTNIQDVMKIAEKKESKSLDLPQMVRVENEAGVLYFIKYDRSLRGVGNKGGEDNLNSAYNFEIWGDSEIELSIGTFLFSTIENTGKVKNSKNIVYFDKDKLTFPLMLRSAIFGDCFRPEGFKGKMKIKKIFNVLKVPEKIRWNTPVIVNNGEVIWLCGYNSSREYSIESNTRAVFKVELSLA